MILFWLEGGYCEDQTGGLIGRETSLWVLQEHQFFSRYLEPVVRQQVHVRPVYVLMSDILKKVLLKHLVFDGQLLAIQRPLVAFDEETHGMNVVLEVVAYPSEMFVLLVAVQLLRIEGYELELDHFARIQMLLDGYEVL